MKARALNTHYTGYTGYYQGYTYTYYAHALARAYYTYHDEHC